MKDYKEFLDHMENKMNELALYSDKLSNIRRLYNSGNFKDSIKNIDILLKELVDNLKNITLEEIKLDIDDREIYKDVIQIDYRLKYENQMLGINELIEDLDDDSVLYKFFPDNETNFNINIDITKKNFNKIDILESLPFCVKGIGLGKKIVEKIIKKYGYVSLQSYTKPSNEITMVFHSLTKDSNYYTFVDESESILVFDKLDKDFIIEVLREFLKDSKIYNIDDDFLKDFNIKEKDFKLFVDIH